MSLFTEYAVEQVTALYMICRQPQSQQFDYHQIGQAMAMHIPANTIHSK